MCDFYGKFTTPKKINDYTYSMHLESLNYSEEEGTVYYEDDIKCTYVEDACGLDYADEIYIYLPGAPVSELPEEFLSWVGITADTYDTLPANYYGLYNITGKMGFSGSSDN